MQLQNNRKWAIKGPLCERELAASRCRKAYRGASLMLLPVFARHTRSHASLSKKGCKMVTSIDPLGKTTSWTTNNCVLLDLTANRMMCFITTQTSIVPPFHFEVGEVGKCIKLSAGWNIISRQHSPSSPRFP